MVGAILVLLLRRYEQQYAQEFIVAVNSIQKEIFPM